MEIKVSSSNDLDTEAALTEVLASLDSIAASLVIAAFNTELNGETISARLSERFDCPVIGCSSCKGALYIHDDAIQGHAALSLFVIIDPSGNYGVGHKEISDNPKAAAMDALDMALYASGRGYESPSLIWCMLPPGNEEDIIEGLAEVVGPHVPVFGGSSADNTVEGAWQQITDVSAGINQISVAVLYPSTSPGISFSSGYEPTTHSVTVTESNNRTIKSINGSRAANIYNELTQGAISEMLQGGNVLALTTLHPFGKKIQTPAGIEDYLLCHPDAISEAGDISLFSQIQEGETLHLMQGSRHSLLQRANRVINNAIELLPEGNIPNGVLMIYCAGCMLTIEDELNVMLEHLREHHPSLPIFGIYTFGEQGCFLDGTNRHGNLMISAVVFSE